MNEVLNHPGLGKASSFERNALGDIQVTQITQHLHIAHAVLQGHQYGVALQVGQEWLDGQCCDLRLHQNQHRIYRLLGQCRRVGVNIEMAGDVAAPGQLKPLSANGAHMFSVSV